MVKIGNNTNDWEMYVDGQAVPMAGDNNVQLTGVNLTNNEPLILGGRSYGGGYIERLQGSMKGANIYLRALPTAEIVERFAQGCNLAPANTDALLLSMPLTDGEGSSTANNAAGGQIGNIVLLNGGTAWTTDPTPNLCNTSPNFVVLQECVGGTSYVQGGYRYGFNGKEEDKETISTTTYDYGFRIYSPALGRFLSVDPLMANYPWYTPYQFAGNMPIKFIDLDGLEEVDPELIDMIDGYTIITFEKWRDLEASEWRSSDRGCACNTFAAAANYNTKNLNSNVYKPVDQIHKYYVWTAREIDKTKANIKFFHAAREVTSLFSVGGAFISPEWLSGLSDAGRQSLADVNRHLLNINMPVINDILNNGGSNIVNGNGIIWDFNYVAREQGIEGLQGILNAKPLSESDAKAINDNFKNFEVIHPEFALAKVLTGVVNIDYKDQKQRMAIGRSLVFLEHMKGKGFHGSKDFYDAVDFLNKEYGNKNVDKFFQVVDLLNSTNIQE